MPDFRIFSLVRGPLTAQICLGFPEVFRIRDINPVPQIIVFFKISFLKIGQSKILPITVYIGSFFKFIVYSRIRNGFNPDKC